VRSPTYDLGTPNLLPRPPEAQGNKPMIAPWRRSPVRTMANWACALKVLGNEAEERLLIEAVGEGDSNPRVGA